MKKIMKTVAVAGFSAWMLLSASLVPSFAGEGLVKEGGMFKKQVHRHAHYHDSIHKQEYLRYLVKEYAPQTQKDWEKAFVERNALMDKIKARMAAMDKQKLRTELKEKVRPEIDRSKLLEERKERRALMEDFSQAVKNHDKKSIRELLPKLLADYKHRTEMISEHAEKM